MTKDEALKMAHKSFMQLNERHPRKDNGNGYFDEEIQACKEALEQQPQEPVAMYENGNVNWINTPKDNSPLYTHPAPSWQTLSADEIDIIDEATWIEDHKVWGIHDFARAIEQALREKNT
jgi:hypothetical protein